MDKRFLRTKLLLGSEAIDRLKGSSVAIFGLGGVGSFAVEALARVGVGRLTLIDHDVVDVTNINRQLHATTQTIGQPKTALMKSRILEINPDAIVDVIDAFYLPPFELKSVSTRDDFHNLSIDATDRFFVNKYDIVLDAIDTVSGKLGLVIECRRRGIAIVSCMGAGNKLDPTRFKVDALSNTTVDPIAKVMRKKLTPLGLDDLRVVYSTETPRALSDLPLDLTATKIIGSVSFVPSVAGLILASEAVRMICEGLT